MKKSGKIVLTLVLGLFAIGLAFGQMHGRGYNLGYLDLSDEQQNTIDKLRLEHQKEMIELRSELDKAYLQLDGYYAENDSKKIKSQLEKINDIKTAMDKKIVDFRERVRAQLTPEQQKLYDNSGFGCCGYQSGMNFHDRDGYGMCDHHGRSRGNYGHGRGHHMFQR